MMKRSFEEIIELMLENCTLEDLFEQLDLDYLEVLERMYESGLIDEQILEDFDFDDDYE